MLFLALLLMALLFTSCQSASQRKLKSCVDCHREVSSAEPTIAEHKLACSLCHGGNEKANKTEEAHKDLVKSPSVEMVFSVCSRCHKSEVEGIVQSQHYTYQKKVKFLLSRFSLNAKVSSMLELISLSKENSLDEKSRFILDFLGKRCLTCHIFYEGEGYASTRRGKGCLACHKPHSYEKPRNEECLSCHHSIRVGMDYFGKTPQNWYVDYRSPFVEGKLPPRPYGIEYHELNQDVHVDYGLNCTNCHGKEEIMFSLRKVNCLQCHSKVLEERLIFHKKEVIRRTSCAVCHARFINQDEYKTCKLVRSVDETERFSEVFVQESWEVENYFLALWEGKNPPPAMKDGLTGRVKEGLWLCFLENRTFERLNLGKDNKGRLCIVRKERLTLLFDNSTVAVDLSLCKSPHTLGKKGDLFRSLEVIKDELSKDSAH